MLNAPCTQHCILISILKHSHVPSVLYTSLMFHTFQMITCACVSMHKNGGVMVYVFPLLTDTIYIVTMANLRSKEGKKTETNTEKLRKMYRR